MGSESAKWNAERAEWGPARFLKYVSFDDAGRVIRLDQRGVDDSVYRTICSYDEAGRLLEMQSGTAGAPHDELALLTLAPPVHQVGAVKPLAA
jgi:hypothetical protein